MIIIPPKRIIEPRRPFHIRTGLAGFWKLEAVNVRTGRRRLLADWFPNLITDQGLDYVGDNTPYLERCCVGTGNAAPTVSDVQLATQIATTTTTQANTSSAQSEAPYYGSRIKTFRFSTGAAEGNVAEIGIGPSSGTPVPVFSRSLILDSEGAPTTITVLSDEVLDATYRLDLYPDVVDAEYAVDISGNSYDVTRRPSLVTNATAWAPSSLGALATMAASFGFYNVATYTGGVGAITASPGGTTISASKSGGLVMHSYTGGNHYRDFTVTWGLNESNNASGIGAIRTVFGASFDGGFGAYQYGFSPAIPKTASDVLALNFRQSWARVSES